MASNGGSEFDLEALSRSVQAMGVSGLPPELAICARSMLLRIVLALYSRKHQGFGMMAMELQGYERWLQHFATKPNHSDCDIDGVFDVFLVSHPTAPFVGPCRLSSALLTHVLRCRDASCTVCAVDVASVVPAINGTHGAGERPRDVLG